VGGLVLLAPVLKVGVGDGQQIFHNGLCGIALFHEEVHGSLGVLALGQLALGAVLFLHNGGNVGVLGCLQAAQPEHLQVDGHRGDPLVGTDDLVDPHEGVVHDVCKMVGGDAVALEQHHVHKVGFHLDVAADAVLVLDTVTGLAGGAHAHDIRLAGLEVLFDLLQRQVTALGVLAPVAGGDALFFLTGAEGGDLFGRAEAGVSQTLFHQVFAEHMVVLGALALGIGGVVALLGIVAGGTFVKGDAEIGEALDDLGNAALDLALFVGVLNAQDHTAAAGVGRTLTDHGGEHAADVQKAGGAGGETGDQSAILQLSGRENFLQQLLGSLGHMWEQQLGQFGMIHHIYHSCKKNLHTFRILSVYYIFF